MYLMAEDPVCNMRMDERKAEFQSQYAGKNYYFCSEECKNKFEHKYEIVGERGRGDGHALDDWLEAEAEVREVVKNPKAA